MDEKEFIKILTNDYIYSILPDNLKSMYLYYKIEYLNKVIKYDKMYNVYKKDGEGVS